MSMPIRSDDTRPVLTTESTLAPDLSHAAEPSVQQGDPIGGGVARVRVRWLAELRRDKLALLGVCFLVGLVIVAVFAPLIAPHDPTKQSLGDRLQPPIFVHGGTWSHLFGTDSLGRDVLSRMIFGSRASLTVGVLVLLVAGSVGITLGLIAGYFGGRLDSLIMRAIDTQLAFPGLLLAIMILTVVQPGVRSLVVVLSLITWMVFARVTRGIVLATRQMPFVEAAEVVGCAPRRIMVRHILPNIASPLMTLLILEFAHVVLGEASLSFLGLGIQPPDMSWGLDVANGRDYLFTAWWLTTFPGLAIVATVLALNTVANWVRLVADPRTRDKRFVSPTTRSAASV